MEITKLLEVGLHVIPPKSTPQKPLDEFFKLFSQCIGEWEFFWSTFSHTAKEMSYSGIWNFSWTLDHRAIHSVCTRLNSACAHQRLKVPSSPSSCNITQFVYVPATDSWDFLWFPFGNNAPRTLNIVLLPPDAAIIQDPYSEDSSKWLISFQIEYHTVTCEQFLPDGEGNWLPFGKFNATRLK